MAIVLCSVNVNNVLYSQFSRKPGNCHSITYLQKYLILLKITTAK